MMWILSGEYTGTIGDSPTNHCRRLYHNAERVRTCNSVVTKTPGLFASVNNSTDPTTDEIIGYISPAGIVSVASQKDQEHDVMTPYGAWPTIMFDKSVGLAWWWNMLQGKKMQSKCPFYNIRNKTNGDRPIWQHGIDEG